MSKAVPLGIVPILAVAFAGCGDDEEVAYCTNSQDQVVENFYCDQDGDDADADSFFWFYTSGGDYSRGAVVNRSKGTRIEPSNKAAIAQRGGFGSSARGSGIGRAGGSSGG